MSYVGEISSAAAAQQMMQAAGVPQVNAAPEVSPYFADLLAAEMESRMVKTAASDSTGSEAETTSDLVSDIAFSGVVLQNAQGTPETSREALQETMAAPADVPQTAAGAIEETGSAPQTASVEEPSYPVAAPVNVVPLGTPQTLIVSASDVPDAGGLQITSVYNGPSLSVYTDPIEAYSQYTDGRYMRSPEELQAARELAADYATGRLGDPYSQSRRGSGDYVDCSYLTQWAYRQIGLSIPGTAAEQARYCANNGYEIPASQLQKGDLIFWQRKGCDCGRYGEIHHVAIYLGDGQIVEASSSQGGVITNSMWGDDGIGSWQIAMCARPA